MKTVLITGGASPDGIGFATARHFAANGYRVCVTGISADETARTPKTERITTAVLDVRDNSAVQRLVSEFERLECLINCAGSGRGPAEFSLDTYTEVIDINLIGTMRCSVAARPLLAASKGAIVNLASMYAYFGSPVIPGYSSAKGGIVQLTKSLACAWASEGIRVNAVAPGWIKTGMSRPVWDNPDYYRQVVSRTPLARMGDPAELAEPIFFLCSDAARFITGVTLPVDGGYSVTG
jgi:NAD(P)-dependent dehydrogenase (short-subunit alcohol dehydrogenase family)